MSKQSPARQAGFTLLEVLISMAILAFIAIAIYNATTETFRLRDSLSVEGEFYNGVRMSINILERDLSALYSPLSFKELGKKPKDKNKSSTADSGTLPGVPPPPDTPDTPDAAVSNFLSGPKGNATKFWAAATDKTGIRSSRFIGDADKLSFISSSHLRVYKEKPESELAKITYELESSKVPEESGTFVLVRTESPNVFEDDESKDRFRRKFPLLRGIKSLKFRYFRKKSLKEWETLGAWDTEKSDLKDKYPDKIELTVEVVGQQRLSFSGIYLFRPEMPYRGVAQTF